MVFVGFMNFVFEYDDFGDGEGDGYGSESGSHWPLSGRHAVGE
jgi:hypothetical protein